MHPVAFPVAFGIVVACAVEIALEQRRARKRGPYDWKTGRGGGR